MSKEISSDLAKFLEPFPDQVRENALWLRDFVWSLHPDSNELIYDNYNALAIGFGLSDRAGDVFCSIAIYSKYSNFGFLRGTEIADPKKLLKGGGSLYRYITVTDIGDFPVEDMKLLTADAYINAVSRLKGEQTLKGAIITKFISPKKRRPA
jgi:hypothetical protein